jgi:hypothetical protein
MNLITQRSVVQIHPPQPTSHRKQTCYLSSDSPRDLSARAVSDKCPKIHWPATFRITATPRFLELLTR